MKKIAIYVRSAVKDEAAIKSQIEFCKNLVDDEDFVVYADNGYSAHDEYRPAFKNMINDIEAGTVNKVIVYSIDRLCRDLKSLCSFWDFIEAHNASFTLVREEVTTENCGLRNVERFIHTINEMEKKSHSEKCRRGWSLRKLKKEVF